MKRMTMLLVLLALLALAGCETFRGFGKDVQRAGKWVERTAEKGS